VELLVTIGDSQFGLQEHGDALRVFEQALAGATRHGIDDSQLLARIHLGLSQNLEYVGRMHDARLAVERSVALLQEAGLAHSKLFVRAKVQQSALYIGIDDMQAAERTAREAIAAAESGAEPSVPELATALQRLSHIYTRTQRRRESLEPARRSYELLETLYAGNAAHPQLLEATTYYAQALQSSGDFERSSQLYTQGVERAMTVFGADSRIVGELLSARSSAELDRGNVDQAVDDATRALRIYLQQAQSGSIDHADRVRKLGTALIAARRVPDAVDRLDEAVRLAAAANAGIQLPHARLNLGLALAHTGRFAEADAELRTALKEAAPNATRARHLAQRNLGTSLRLQGRPAEAIKYLELALAGASVEASHRGDLAQGLVEAALARLALDEPDAARDLLERADRLFVDVQRDRMSPARADLLLAQGRLRLAQGDAAGAMERLEQANRYWHERDPSSRWAGEAHAWLAVCYRRAGRGEEAEAYWLRARSILGHSPPLNSAVLPL
jgi:tetratricopeptide (TPR) repeat protein